MINWRKINIGKAIAFNPAESIAKGSIAKKIPMASLTEFQRKINSYELSEYKSGPKFRNCDTLLSKITPCLENGKTAYVDILQEDEVAFGSSEFIVLRSTDQTDSEFVYYLAISPTFRKRAISCMEGTSGRKRVNENTLKYYELPFPELNEQKQIAKVLSDLDAKIEVNNKINAELEALAKTIYDYWFVQFDFPTSADYAASVEKPEMTGKPYKSSGGKMVYNEELKRKIPEGWEVSTLENNIEFKRGISYTSKSTASGEGIPMINLKSFNLDGSYRIDGLKYYNGKVNKNKYINSGDLLIAITDVTRNADIIGKGIIVPSIGDDQMVASCDISSVICNEKLNKHYLRHLFNSEYYHNYIKHFASGTLVLHLDLNGVNWYKDVIPPINLQDKFGQLVDKYHSKGELIRKENQKLSELRDWLLPMLMNGQVRVAHSDENQDLGDLGMVAEEEVNYK